MFDPAQALLIVLAVAALAVALFWPVRGHFWRGPHAFRTTTRLVAEELYPDMRVRVAENAPQRIRFESGADEHVLAPANASNISAIPLPEEQEMRGPFKCLSALSPGQRAHVIGISPVCRAPERRRMFDLGIIPGTIVEVDMESPCGDPTAYRIRGTVIAMRREQAEMIQVSRVENGAAP